MPVRVGLKRLRLNLIRMSTKSYIRMITGLVIVGLFISEGSVKDVSEARSMTVTSKLITTEHSDETQFSSISEETNRTKKTVRSGTNSSTSTAKVSRTLQEILHEAIPEQIFGLSNGDRNVSSNELSGKHIKHIQQHVERQIHNSSSFMQESTFGESRRGNGSLDDNPVAPVPYQGESNSSRTQVSTERALSQTSPNGTNSEKDLEQTIASNHHPFKGILSTEETKHLFETDNVTHLSFMLYRLIKTHDIKSVLDVPCRQSLLWMKDLLQILEFEVPKFHYKCLAPDDKSLAEGVVRLQHLSSATVLKNAYPWASRLSKADLALCWYGLGFLPPYQSWGLLKALRRAGVKFVLVPNYPDVRHNPGMGSASGRINVRRAPYRFNEPLRVVNNVSSQASILKQLLLYDLDGIRRDAL